MRELLDYWTDHPPLHLMVAAYLGVKPKEAARTPDENDLRELVALFQR